MKILFLAHRTPYPPNKGEKIRAWHFLKHISEKHSVRLGYFEDVVEDFQHRPVMQQVSDAMCVVRVSSFAQKLFALKGLLTGSPLSVSAYPAAKMRQFVRDQVQEGVDLIFVYSAPMMAMLPNAKELAGVPIILDMVDVDSEKYRAYAAEGGSGLMRAIYGREYHKLAAFEKQIANRAHETFFVSEAEAGVFKADLSDATATVSAIPNGVNLRVFDPRRYEVGEGKRLIFTGSMTYRPNIEAVVWFADYAWPELRARHPDLMWVIAGSPVDAEVSRLSERDGIHVTGRVDDMAAEIAQATVSIAPLKTARGLQNKVLEAMAMATPVVSSKGAAEGIVDTANEAAIKVSGLTLAEKADDWIEAIDRLLRDADARRVCGLRSRAYVEMTFSWDAALQMLDAVIARNSKSS